MSAFVVEDSTINATLTWIEHAQYTNGFGFIANSMLPRAGYDLKDPETLPRLAREMFALNCQAVNQRYGEDAAAQFRRLDFQFHHNYSAANAAAALKLLECWQYQCSEGDVPDTPLYQLINSIIAQIALGIVHATDAYERAPWGN